MIVKAETITIIGKLNIVEKAIKKLQEGEKIEWFVFQSEQSKKIPEFYVIKLMKKGEEQDVNKQ